jgi:hypothetical protein
MPARLENPEDVDDVRGEVGEEERDGLVQQVVPRPGEFVDRGDGNAQESDDGIIRGERGKHLPGQEIEHRDINRRGQAARNAVLDELDDRMRLALEELFEDRFQNSGLRFQVSGFRFPHSGFRFPVSGFPTTSPQSTRAPRRSTPSPR